jgi:hypothetical protein
MKTLCLVTGPEGGDGCPWTAGADGEARGQGPQGRVLRQLYNHPWGVHGPFRLARPTGSPRAPRPARTQSEWTVDPRRAWLYTQAVWHSTTRRLTAVCSGLLCFYTAQLVVSFVWPTSTTVKYFSVFSLFIFSSPHRHWLLCVAHLAVSMYHPARQRLLDLSSWSLGIVASNQILHLKWLAIWAIIDRIGFAGSWQNYKINR